MQEQRNNRWEPTPELDARGRAWQTLGKLLISGLALGCLLAGIWHTEATSNPKASRSVRAMEKVTSRPEKPAAQSSPKPTKTVSVLPSLTDDEDSNGRGKLIRLNFRDSIFTVEILNRDPGKKVDRNSPLVIQLSPKDGLELSPPVLTWAQFPKDSLTSVPIAYRNAPTDAKARIRADVSAKVCDQQTGNCQRLKDRVDLEFTVPRN